ncbi:MAG: acyl-CoA dehydrogenase family protein [Pseudomonadota bacterium]
MTTMQLANEPTHDVKNQPPELVDFNAFSSDMALQDAVRREGAAWGLADLEAFGEQLGSAEIIKMGYQANEYPPRLKTHDHLGRRIDDVEFHPAYHQLFKIDRAHDIHAYPWNHPGPGAHVFRAAKSYLMNQVEPAHCCPTTMTYASVPLLRDYPELGDKWVPLITNAHYDPRNLPVEQKRGAMMGMAVTEKQGGSDVYQIATRAEALSEPGSGQPYSLTGHKFFVSGVMSDAFTLLAQTRGGLSCFVVPRFREDGSKNQFEIQRLKNKMGNIANATAEVELRGAMGWLVGEEGRGLQTIIKAIAYNRFDCIVGSAAGMRQAVVQAIHHCQNRIVFGKTLSEQPIMQNVLADLALESEAAAAYSFRLARALDEVELDPKQKHYIRLGTALGKFRICKRVPGHAYEALECVGGSGAMEGHMMPRLYREAPINAIWEGSGNVQALDASNTIARSAEARELFFADLALSQGKNTYFDSFVDALSASCSPNKYEESQGRHLTNKMAVAAQASALLQGENQLVAEAFCASRLVPQDHSLYGNLPDSIDCGEIIKRAAVA